MDMEHKGETRKPLSEEELEQAVGGTETPELSDNNSDPLHMLHKVLEIIHHAMEIARFP